MQKFKWKIDLSDLPKRELAVRLLNQETIPTDKEWFIRLFDGACTTAFPQGMAQAQLRLYMKICDKVEKAKIDFVHLEDADFKLLKQAFDSGKFMPAAAKLVSQIYDNLDKVKEVEAK